MVRWEASESIGLERRDPGGAFAVVHGGRPVASWADSSVVSAGDYEYRVVGATTRAILSDTLRVQATEAPLPTPPTDLSPAADAIEVVPWSRFSWTGTGSKVAINSHRDGLRVHDVSAQSFEPSPPLVFDDRITWKVLAVGENGVGVWSEASAFWTQPERYVVFEGYFFMGDVATVHPGNPIWIDSYSIDRFEVTNDQFARILNRWMASGEVRHDAGAIVDVATSHVLARVCEDETGCSELELGRRGGTVVVLPGRGRHPVGNVTWFGADRYARTIGRRLPTEAEWEKAARGTTPALGDTTLRVIRDSAWIEVEVGLGYPYPWGEGIGGNLANYMDSSDPFESLEVASTPIGFYDGGVKLGFATAPNTSPYGADDMAGNVSEWTADWFGTYKDPHEPPDVSLAGRVVRGGSWNDRPELCKNAARLAMWPEMNHPWLGFRTVGAP